MKKSIFTMLTAMAALLVFTGLTLAETYQIRSRSQNQNRNTIQNRRQKQNLSCQTVMVNPLQGPITGKVSECNYDGLTISVEGTVEPLVVNGLGPERYWEINNLSKPRTGDLVTVYYRVVKFSDTVEKNILFSLAFVDESSGEIIAEIDLRDAETGCPLWRSW